MRLRSRPAHVLLKWVMETTTSALATAAPIFGALQYSPPIGISTLFGAFQSVGDDYVAVCGNRIEPVFHRALEMVHGVGAPSGIEVCWRR